MAFSMDPISTNVDPNGPNSVVSGLFGAKSATREAILEKASQKRAFLSARKINTNTETVNNSVSFGERRRLLPSEGYCCSQLIAPVSPSLLRFYSNLGARRSVCAMEEVEATEGWNLSHNYTMIATHFPGHFFFFPDRWDCYLSMVLVLITTLPGCRFR